MTAGTLSGTYGSLVLNANGTYTYTLNPNDGAPSFGLRV
ncbi:VCBS domain-containing protein [Aeromonas caviae]